ncbi:MAG: coiled-coil domain-containing protein, partial [Gaiellaceae bacterium]
MRVRALIAAVVVVALSAAAAGTAAPPEVRSKQAQAARVLAEINGIDARLGHTVEAWNGANLRLASVERELKTNTAQLEVARAQYRVAQRRIAQRLVAIYVAGEPDMVDVILGASNVGDLIDGLDAVSKVTAQDRRIARQASALKAKLDSHERLLVRARAEQRATLADLTAKRAQIQSSLATRRRLLSSIRGQIARIEAARRAQEARLAAQARARLA